MSYKSYRDYPTEHIGVAKIMDDSLYDEKGNRILSTSNHDKLLEKALEEFEYIVIAQDMKINSVTPSTTKERIIIKHVKGKIDFIGDDVYMIDLENAPAKILAIEGLRVVGKGADVTRQGLVKVGSNTNVLEYVEIKRCDIRNILPEGGTSIFNIMHIFSKRVNVIGNYFEHVDPSLVPSGRTWDTLTIGYGDDENTVTVAKRNYVKWFQDAIAMWGGLCVAEENYFDTGASDVSQVGVDFARCKVAVARKNKGVSPHFTPMIYYHLASGTLPAKLAVIEENEAVITTGGLQGDSLIAIEAGEHVIIRKNRVEGAYKGINIWVSDGEIDTLIIEDNKISNPGAFGIYVYANSYNINRLFIRRNISKGASTDDIYVGTATGYTIGLLVIEDNDVDTIGIPATVTERHIRWNKGKAPEIGYVGYYADCANIPSTPLFDGHMVVCYDTGTGTYKLKVGIGGAWKDIASFS